MGEVSAAAAAARRDLPHRVTGIASWRTMVGCVLGLVRYGLGVTQHPGSPARFSPPSFHLPPALPPGDGRLRVWRRVHGDRPGELERPPPCRSVDLRHLHRHAVRAGPGGQPGLPRRHDARDPVHERVRAAHRLLRGASHHAFAARLASRRRRRRVPWRLQQRLHLRVRRGRLRCVQRLGGGVSHVAAPIGRKSTRSATRAAASSARSGCPRRSATRAGRARPPSSRASRSTSFGTSYVEQRVHHSRRDAASRSRQRSTKNGDGDLDDEDLSTLALENGDESRRSTSDRCSALYVRVDERRTKSPWPFRSTEPACGARSPGYLALDPEGTEVGATFFAPKETPGLGAEIMEDCLRVAVGRQGVHRRRRRTTPRPFAWSRARPKNLCPDDIEHCVDGVSGATITSRGVDEMVAQALEWYDPYLSKASRRLTT